MTDNTYNGWRNWETWNCKLWLDNDGSGETWTARAQELYDDTDTDDSDEDRTNEASNQLAKELEGWHDDIQEDLGYPTAGFFADILMNGLGAVDWREIADSYLGDIERPEPKTSEEEAPTE